MKILFDINHPAHVHFFHHPARVLKERGHEVLVTSREKDVALPLLKELGIRNTSISSIGKGGMTSLFKELIHRDWALYKIVKQEKPDVMASIGGTFIAHVGLLTDIPALVFYDTENAHLQNAITYPLASKVLVPRCYQGWVPRKKEIRYNGYHELSYLHPNVFRPDKQTALANGLDNEQNNFLIRVVSWQANHDLGENFWSLELLNNLISWLKPQGNIIISSERPLPKSLEPYRYSGNVSDIHHVMAFCKAFIGESATMASEAAVLGVPAIYAAETGRGYTDEQEKLYDLVKNIRNFNQTNLQETLDYIISKPESYWQSAQNKLLKGTIDVSDFIVDQIKIAATPSSTSQARQVY